MIVFHSKDRKHEAVADNPVFTGPVQRSPLSDTNNAKQLALGHVSFSAGGRTVWHTHTFEQGLVILSGKGIVATEAHEHIVEPGDVIVIPEGEKHWHGGTNATSMSHISIGAIGGRTIPGEPVEKINTANP